MTRKGKLILVMGPSGSGKGTMIGLLKERRADFVFPVSATTRSPRDGEVDGENYYFLTKEEFELRLENGEFLEHALVHGKAYYGTLKESILGPINEGKNVVREIDVQGFMSIRSVLDSSIFSSIFILPPSKEILIKRITERSAISEEELFARMDSLLKEVEFSKFATLKMDSGHLPVEKMYEDFVLKLESLIG